MRRSKSWRWLCLAALASVALAVTACGSDDNGDSSSSSSSSSTTSSTSTPSSAIPEATQTYYDENIKTPSEVGDNGPLDKKPPTGLTVDFLACALPTCEQQAGYFSEAVKNLGWTVKTVTFELSAEGIQKAFNTAIADKPTGGVVTSGFVKQAFAQQLAKLKDMGVPVVDYFSGNDAGDGIVSAVGNDAILKFSDNMASWATVDGGGKANVIEFNVTSFGVQKIMHDRIEKQLKGGMCTECEYTFNDLALTDLGPNLPAKVVSAVQRAPKTTHLIFGFSELTTGVPAALKNAGLSDKVKIITAGPEQPTFQSIMGGEITAATAQPLEEQQWCMADALARHASGTEVPEVACDLPSQILTKDNVTEAWKVWPGVPDWKNAFLEDWNV